MGIEGVAVGRGHPRTHFNGARISTALRPSSTRVFREHTLTLHKLSNRPNREISYHMKKLLCVLVTLGFALTLDVPAGASTPPNFGSLTAGTIAARICALEGCYHVVAFTARTDPNKTLGKPGSYMSKADFRDRRVTDAWLSKNFESCPDTSCGGGVEVFRTAAQALARAKYLQSFSTGGGLPAGGLLAGERDLVARNVVLRLSGGLPASAVTAYRQELQKVTGLSVQVLLPRPSVGGNVTVKGTPEQPTAVYSVRLQQVWSNLSWTDGNKATVPVQIEVTITNTGHVPVLDETPAQDLTLTVPSGSTTPAWSGKYDSDANTFECQGHGALPSTWSPLNPGRSVTGCVVFAVPSKTWSDGSVAAHLWWIPEGAIQQDQKSYAWALP